jgi:hypothetical protein
MELDITDFFETAEPFDFSASIAERGVNAGRDTWHNAKQEAASSPPVTDPDELEKVRDWFGEFGAWDDEERAAWNADDINALLIQFISGDIREAESVTPADTDDGIDWDLYERKSAEGTVSGHMFKATDGRIYFYVGS